MKRRQPRSKRTDTLFPYTTLFRTAGADDSTSNACVGLEVRLTLTEPLWVAIQSKSGSASVSVTLLCGKVMPNTNRRSVEHTSELQSLMRISYAVFCLKKKIIYIFLSFFPFFFFNFFFFILFL